MQLHTLLSTLVAIAVVPTSTPTPSSPPLVLKTRITTHILLHQRHTEGRNPPAVNIIIPSDERPTTPTSSAPQTTFFPTQRSPTTSNTWAPGFTPPPIPPPSTCWSDDACFKVWERPRACYHNATTDIGYLDPRNDTQAGICQAYLCDSEGEGVRQNPAAKDLEDCMNCFRRDQLSESIIAPLSHAFDSFCATPNPSFYLYILDLLAFLHDAGAPYGFAQFDDETKNITTLATLYTPSPGLNSGTRPTHIPVSTALNSAQAVSSWWRLSSMLASQLEKARWPGEAPGVARRAGQFTTFTGTDDRRSAHRLVMSLPWQGRALGNQKPREWTLSIVPPKGFPSTRGETEGLTAGFVTATGAGDDGG